MAEDRSEIPEDPRQRLMREIPEQRRGDARRRSRGSPGWARCAIDALSRFHTEPTGIARLIALSALAVAPAVSWGIVQQLLGWSDGAIVWVPVSSFGLALWLTPRLSTSPSRALPSPQDRPA